MKKTLKINLILFLFTALLLGSNFLIKPSLFKRTYLVENAYAQERTNEPTLPNISSEDELNYDEHYEQIVLFIIYTEENDPTSLELQTAENWLNIIENKTQIEVNQKMQSIINRTSAELPLTLSAVTIEHKSKVNEIYSEIDYLLTSRQQFVNNSYLLADFNNTKIFVTNCKNKIDKIEEDTLFATNGIAKLDEKMPAIMQRSNFDESEEQELRDLYTLSAGLQNDYASYLTDDELNRAKNYESFLYKALKTFDKSEGSNLKPLAIYIVGAVCFLSVGIFLVIILRNIPDAKYEMPETTKVKRRDLIGRYRLQDKTKESNKDDEKN